MTADEIIKLLDLKPLPHEGGYYRETYRAETTLAAAALPDVYRGERNAATAIYFLLTPDEHSAMHILPSDEVFHHYTGDPVEMLRLFSGGKTDLAVMGSDLAAGHRPQVVVPGGVWQGCRLAAGGAWALLGCTVAPGFDFEDFHVATPEEINRLAGEYQERAAVIHQLAPRTG